MRVEVGIGIWCVLFAPPCSPEHPEEDRGVPTEADRFVQPGDRTRLRKALRPDKRIESRVEPCLPTRIDHVVAVDVQPTVFVADRYPRWQRRQIRQLRPQ